MPTTFQLLAMALAGCVVGLWWTSSRAKELAISHARRACSQAELQLLDQTVALTTMRPTRSRQGTACFWRVYSFEFAAQNVIGGSFRDTGSVTMKGYALQGVTLPFVRDEQGNRIFVH